MTKEFTVGKKPEGINWKEAMKKPLILNYEQIDDDFLIVDYDEKGDLIVNKYNKDDYLVLGKYDSLMGWEKEDFEKEHDLEVSEEYKIKRYFSNKDNRKQLFGIASQIDELMRSNWFTIDKLAKKSKEDKDQLNDRLTLLILMGLCKYETGDKETNYKIILNSEVQKEILNTNIREMNEKIEMYQEELQRIENEKKE